MHADSLGHLGMTAHGREFAASPCAFIGTSERWQARRSLGPTTLAMTASSVACILALDVHGKRFCDCPVKTWVRETEGLEVGDTVTVRLAVGT